VTTLDEPVLCQAIIPEAACRAAGLRHVLFRHWSRRHSQLWRLQQPTAGQLQQRARGSSRDPQVVMLSPIARPSPKVALNHDLVDIQGHYGLAQ
jgi:hypothetical protein